MIHGKSFVGIKVKASDINDAKAAVIRLASPQTRSEALKQGALTALDVIREYYNSRGRLPWINPKLKTHGPGRTPTKWWMGTVSGWSIARATGRSVTFANAAIGLAHKVTGGTIRAKRKKFLTIPIVPQAHGMTATSYARKYSPLFVVKGVLAEKDGDGIRPVFALKKSVTHKPWPNALPPEESYVTAMLNSALDYIIEKEYEK